MSAQSDVTKFPNSTIPIHVFKMCSDASHNLRQLLEVLKKIKDDPTYGDEDRLIFPDLFYLDYVSAQLDNFVGIN